MNGLRKMGPIILFALILFAVVPLPARADRAASFVNGNSYTTAIERVAYDASFSLLTRELRSQSSSNHDARVVVVFVSTFEFPSSTPAAAGMTGHRFPSDYQIAARCMSEVARNGERNGRELISPALIAG